MAQFTIIKLTLGFITLAIVAVVSYIVWGTSGRSTDIEGSSTEIDAGDEKGKGSVISQHTVTLTSNLLRNPGFEEGFDFWDQTYNPIHSIDSTDPHSGRFAVKAVERLGTNEGWLVQDVTGRIEVGKQYKVDGWLKLDNTKGVYIRLLFVDAQGRALPYVPEAQVSSGDFVQTLDWTFFESPDFTVTENLLNLDTKALFVIDTKYTGVFFVDDLELVEVSTAR